jgi:predicted TIM-barrel fold metal-dependent hydrolase
VDHGPIVNTHEHISSLARARTLLEAMDALDIERTVLLGSSLFTLTLDPRYGFTGYDENNEELLRIQSWAPDRFEAWPTLSPTDPENLRKLERLHERGACGLKLFIGHGYRAPGADDFFFHTMAIDDGRMLPVYDYCERNSIPICLHLNPTGDDGAFFDEFLRMMRAFPALRVNTPHWALSSIRISRLESLMTEFPHLMADVSFGHDTYLAAGLRRVSANVEKYRRFIAAFPDRLMFGTDFVITAEPRKSPEWITSRTRDYLGMLGEVEYRSDLLPEESLRGMALDRPLLDRILRDNALRFIRG